jgi:hypothetical protein
MAIRILEIAFDDNDIGMQKLAAKIAIELREEFSAKFGGVNRVELSRVAPEQQKIVPLYGHMKTRSRINNVVQLSGIAHPHLDGPGNGGSAA